MSDFTFSCSSCGQHLSIDTSSCGAQMTCPVCQKTIVVPAAPAAPAAGPRLAISSSAPGASAAPPSRFSQPPPVAPQGTSGLAIASLVCSIASFLFLPFGFIPGIICGHMASKRIRQNLGLGGRGLAKAGLILGYISLILYVIVILVFTGMFLFVGRQVLIDGKRQMLQQNQAPIPAAPTAESPTDAQPEAAPVDTTPDPAGWKLNLTAADIPATPVSGRIHGQPFKLEKVEYLGGFLKFKQGANFFADLEMDAVLFVSAKELPGKTFNFGPDKSSGLRPHIYMHWTTQGNSPNQKSWMDKYAICLEFGQFQNGKIPGKIYLCVPDAEKSFVRGTFLLPVSGQ